jgi:DNA invertase Pin-like site-specific DNA recombinase
MIDIRAALYARVSSEHQATAQTIASQVAALRERVAADGLRLLDELVFVDDGFSGATLVRPALERLRDAAAAGEVERLYVHSPDRLARRYAYQVLLVDELQRAGVELVFLNRAVGETPEDELLLQVQGIVAEYERAKLLERVRRGRRHAARIGAVSALGHAPYGYRYVSRAAGGGQARYEVVPDQAWVVRRVFDWVARERTSMAEVARRLMAAGVPPRAAGRRGTAARSGRCSATPPTGARPRSARRGSGRRAPGCAPCAATRWSRGGRSGSTPRRPTSGSPSRCRRWSRRSCSPRCRSSSPRTAARSASSGAASSSSRG